MVSVPEEAVGAAAQCLIHGWLRYPDANDFARAILEAAAPHMFPTPKTHSLEDVAAEFGIDLDELRREASEAAA